MVEVGSHTVRICCHLRVICRSTEFFFCWFAYFPGTISRVYFCGTIRQWVNKQQSKVHWRDSVGISHSHTDNQTPSVAQSYRRPDSFNQVKQTSKLLGQQTPRSQNQSHFATDSQSVCLGVEPRLGLMTRFLFMIGKLQSCLYGGGPSLLRGRVCLLSVIVNRNSPCHLYNIYNMS
jgi:hypothetical protein